MILSRNKLNSGRHKTPNFNFLRLFINAISEPNTHKLVVILPGTFLCTLTVGPGALIRSKNLWVSCLHVPSVGMASQQGLEAEGTLPDQGCCLTALNLGA